MQLMNAIPVLNEVRHALAALRETGEPRTLNILNFPLTDDDSRLLDETLGRGDLKITYDGMEHTFWQEAKIAGVWWGEYRNAGNHVVLRTIEIAEFPALARSQREDMEDGLRRLDDALNAQAQDEAAALEAAGS